MSIKKKTSHVLIIEDDPISRLMVKKILENSGYTVSECGDIKTGVDKAKEIHPHIIFLDLSLPDGSGFDFLEKRKSIPEISKAPVVVLTSTKTRESVERAISYGVTEYLTKPVDARVLLRKVMNLCRELEFPAVQFPTDRRPRVEIQTQGKIVLSTETGFIVEAPIKIAGSTHLPIDSPVLREFALSDAYFKTDSKGARPGFPGMYLVNIIVAGVSPEAAERIRKASRGGSGGAK